jgi:LuxR family maltose regulon positive regulatory protein
MAVYGGADEEVVQSNVFRATMLVSIGNLYWIAADLQGLAQVSDRAIELCDYPHSAEIRGIAQYHLGCAYYHQNELGAAEEHFASVVQQPYQNYGYVFAHSACGLARTYQARGRFDKAQAVASSAVAFMLETGNTTLLPVAQAFKAEIDLAQGQLAKANQWAAQFDSIPPLAPLTRFYEPHLTLIKIWLAQNTPDKRQQAADSLDQLKEYTESTHNTRFLAEVLALQAILQAAEDNEPSALTLLEEAIELAQPGGFIRLFVDLGPPIGGLLDELHRRGVAPDYIAQILAAFPDSVLGDETIEPRQSAIQNLVQPLTKRELEVLALLNRHLTNKEIAEELVVSPSTVKTHTLNIYRKLEVHGRKRAVAKARELGILPPNVV